ncbi:Imm1 family immunity protein [Saccharopolyspora hattusasensis]|uniref:Imm1 family immunity protein n=1 Tax=Saccharopolyspora hattusasensis TaxID=1128679 RepID=UPI003D9661E1
MTIDARWAVFTEDWCGTRREPAREGPRPGARARRAARRRGRRRGTVDPPRPAAVGHRARVLRPRRLRHRPRRVRLPLLPGPTRDKAYPEGDPASEGCEFDDDDFPPGSGLPVERFTEVLVEFLNSADRPASVTWRDEAAGV